MGRVPFVKMPAWAPELLRSMASQHCQLAYTVHDGHPDNRVVWRLANCNGLLRKVRLTKS